MTDLVWWRRPIDLGVGPKTSGSRAKHVRLVNFIAYLGVVSYLGYFCWYVAIGATVALSVNVTTLVGFVACWWLNHRRRYRLAAIVLSVVVMASQLFWCAAFGPLSYYHLPFLGIIASGPLLVHWTDGRHLQWLLPSIHGVGFALMSAVLLGGHELPGRLSIATELEAANGIAAHVVTFVIVFVCAVYISRNSATVERHLAERSLELEAALDDLRLAQSKLVESEKQAAVGRLAAGVAHEINTPLGALHSSVTMLAKVVAGLVPDDDGERTRAERRLARVSSLVETIEEAASRIGSAAGNLEHFTAVDAGELRPMNLAESMSSTLGILRGAESVEFRQPGELPLVVASQARIHHALLALLEHALERTQEEGPWVDIQGSADAVTVTIADDGVALDPAACEALFDLELGTQEGRVGLRLSLPLARRAVQEAGGTLVVEPRPEGGSRSVLVLPVAR